MLMEAAWKQSKSKFLLVTFDHFVHLTETHKPFTAPFYGVKTEMQLGCNTIVMEFRHIRHSIHH